MENPSDAATVSGQSANPQPGIAQSPLPMPRSFQRPTGLDAAETALRVNSHRQKKRGQERVADMVTRRVATTLNTLVGDATKTFAPPAAVNDATPTGQLASQFESGSEGISAIGYDRHGGTSYGKFQISSRAGTMRSFLSFLKTEEPQMASRLEQAGAANTGSKNGGMPEEWKKIAAESPERFESLQDRFIHNSHFEPAMEAIAEKTGIAFEGMPRALKEVLFSTAVQHGPNGAARIFSKAIDQVGQAKLDPEKSSPETLKKTGETLIRNVYAMRSNQFESSSQTVQNSVKSRLKQEMRLAIDMLHSPQGPSIS